MPTFMLAGARDRPHALPHTTGFTVLFRMGPSWGCFKLAVEEGRVVGTVTGSLRVTVRLLVTCNAHVPIPGRAPEAHAHRLPR